MCGVNNSNISGGNSMPIYEKTVRNLLKQYISEKNLSAGDIFSHQDAIEWFNKNILR